MSTTPPPLHSAPRLSAGASSTASDDDFAWDLSFKYVTGPDGQLVRVSHGRSTPPTPPEPPRAPTPEYIPSPSPPSQPGGRQSLNRTGSYPSELKPTATTTPAHNPRSLTRTASGPIPTVTPGAASSRGIVSGLVTSLPRRPSASEDYRRHDLDRLQTQVSQETIYEGKENLEDRVADGVGSLKRRTLPPPRSAPPTSTEAHLYARSVGPGAKPVNALVAQQQQQRARQAGSLPARSSGQPVTTRMVRRAVPPPRDQIEAREREREREREEERREREERTEPELPDMGTLKINERPVAATRYRRSASVSDGPSPEPPRYKSTEPNRPGSSASGRVARAALESRYRRELAEDGTSESDRDRQYEQNPSPPERERRAGSDEFRPAHVRRGSDTVRHLNGGAVNVAPPARLAASSSLRSLIPSPPPLTPSPPPPPVRFPSPPPLDSPTAAQLPPHLSPDAYPAAGAKHRRNPTATESSTNSATLAPSESVSQPAKTWTAENQSPPLPVPALAPRPATAVPAAARPAPVAPQLMHQNNRNNATILVNGKPYARLNLLGKGGSSRVFRALTSTNEILAVKRVALDQADQETVSGYMNEIQLLKRLAGNKRIIRLYDSEVVEGPKSYLNMVLECGEVDLAKLLSEAAGKPLNMIKVADYWQQMLEAVHVVHEEKIVHSDLKPANFVLVRGQLKLIDFGIANAIAADTTNIQRDHQVGTVNYMSPEAIEVPEGMRRLKVGRPSDVWSLGCILYQMIYGLAPFHRFTKPLLKMKAIPDPRIEIEFGTHSIPIERAADGSLHRLEHLSRRVRSDVVACMQSCLQRNPKERATIPELLEQDWLTFAEPQPVAPPPPPPPPQPRILDLLAEDETVINPYYMEQLIQYVLGLGGRDAAPMDPARLRADGIRLVQELRSVHVQEEARRIELAQQAAAMQAQE